MSADDWIELEVPSIGARNLIRYRRRTDLPSGPPSFDLEIWHETRRKWRTVNSLQARDWFAIGMLASAEARS